MRIHEFRRAPPATPESGPSPGRPRSGLPPPPDPTGPTFDIHELWARTGSAVRTGLPRAFRVCATVAHVRPRRQGNYDLDLVPTHGFLGGNAPVVSARIGAEACARIAAALERPFDPMELEHRDVTLTCTASWLSDARLRLNVIAVEPAWRVSEAELERARILDGLRRAGLLEAQRQLPSPDHLARVSVLHPPGQGWSDIAETLHALADASHLRVDDLACRFDGPGAVPELIRRLDEAAKLHAGCEDRGLVLLVRGGGSPARALDSREVAAAIGTLTVPVVVAVGHRTDAATIADMVAWASLPTPSEARHLVLTLLDDSAARAERAWADLVAALGDLERSSHRAGIAGCETVADAAEACLEAAERRAATAARALEGGLERTLAVLTARERTACAAPDRPAAWPEGFVRLTDAAGHPINGLEAAVGPVNVTFADGRTLAVAPVAPLDPTIH
ncbi:exodeoxyribonuclease VII large subunit [Methylobacterium persicinum]|uniref:Exodeoxyribonuclease VII large subunit n=1 Tax=Methylobacterium persicinum TaxID=374426 RepID=A0ABU0HSV8_9HYPH|nr:exodeoxyribonuclease VII large subunit [Methylobacterium persicinum]MDQ0445413.1 exodeoxyribonuclease VII large subunit [Methylobacterium persicinum]GJE36023.1 Exodeoxyribonuclease 7 large subunit [Methylobacterium persicinum]